jgi:hypothetical protein
MADFTGMPVQARALPYVDKSVSELSAGQATGAASVMTANADRLAISIMPNANGRLYYTGAAAADGPYYRSMRVSRARSPGQSARLATST